VWLSLFAAFWLRPASSFEIPDAPFEDVVAALAHHLFVRYPFPAFLTAAWLQDRDDFDARWPAWFVTLAQGGSLAKLSRAQERRRLDRMGPMRRLRLAVRKHNERAVVKGLQTHLFSVPGDAPLVHGVMRAEIERLGGGPVEVRRLVDQAGYRFDPTRPDSLPYERAFWRNMVTWFCRHRGEIPEGQSPRIIEWGTHRYTEALCEDREFSFTKRTVQAVLREIHREDERLRRETEIAEASDAQWYNWESHSWDWRAAVAQTEWTIRELTSHRELNAESEMMHHCVWQYRERCATGRSAIFRLTRNGAGVLTIELDPRTRAIVQARGIYNRPATQTERAVLSMWSAEKLESDSIAES
jgi:hypothetical protein